MILSDTKPNTMQLSIRLDLNYKIINKAVIKVCFTYSYLRFRHIILNKHIKKAYCILQN
jgi:hypothetical protein